MISFAGTGHRLADADIERAAKQLDIFEATLRAVIDVETSGSGFGSDNRPLILFEPHVFYRLLPVGPDRERAVGAGLAYPKQGTKPYPRSQKLRYTQLLDACLIDEEAALKSCSWGLGQLMGYNYRLCGYATVYDLVAAAKAGEAEQLQGFCNYVKSTKLDVALRQLDWEKFAKGYNGPGYKANQYDVKLENAYLRFRVELASPRQAQQEKTTMASNPPWPPTMDAEAQVFGERLTAKYDGQVDHLGWVRWSSDFRMLRGNNHSPDDSWNYINHNIDLIRSGQAEEPYPPGAYDVPWPPTMDQEADWFGQKLEAFYRDPGQREGVDYLGWVRWSSDYRVLRANGVSQENAWLRIENDIRQIWGLPPILPEPSPFPRRTGATRLEGRCFADDGGKFLALGYTDMHGAATCAKFPTEFDEDHQLLARYGLNYTRKIAFLDGGRIDPDPWLWGNDEGAGNTSAARIVAAIKRDYDENGLRTFLTFWGGLRHWDTQTKRKAALHELLPLLRPIVHCLLGGEITNEQWMNWAGIASMEDMRELAGMVKQSLGQGFPLAMSAPSGVADSMSTDVNAQFKEIKDMYYQNANSNLATYHFDRDVSKVCTLWRPYRQPWENVIVVPAPDQNQNIAGYLGLPPGTILTPTASVNNEPIGDDSSGESDSNADRQVIAAVITFVAGEAGHDWHTDQGVWRDMINPVYLKPGRGDTRRVSQVPNFIPILEGYAGMMRTLPGDLPTWSRTRHGLANHPFGPSFRQQGNGFTQIWPDGVTNYGVVRAYCAYKGVNFVCPLLGIKDHFDLVADKNMKVVLFRPAGWETIATLTLSAGQTYKVTQPEVVAVGQYV